MVVEGVDLLQQCPAASILMALPLNGVTWCPPETDVIDRSHQRVCSQLGESG